MADSYLSVATPVQSALGGVLALAPRIRAAIRERALGNLALLRAAVAGLPAVELFEPQGGWAVLLRISLPVADEDLVLELLERAGVLVIPATSSTSRRTTSSSSPCSPSRTSSGRG